MRVRMCCNMQHRQPALACVQMHASKKVLVTLSTVHFTPSTMHVHILERTVVECYHWGDAETGDVPEAPRRLKG